MSTNPKNQVLQQLANTPAVQIPELAIVRDRYIQNYNHCHGNKLGDLMYHRNVVFFKQAIASNDKLAAADPLTLYACFVTAAAKGYSLDPNDDEVYLIARGKSACLDRQAGAYVKRLLQTGQAKFFEQAKLVYRDDIFEVENGRVLRHIEMFRSDEIIAGYVRVVLDENGTDRFFIYRKSDFASWRKKSPNPRTIERQGANGNYLIESLWDNGQLNGINPEPNFLRTKIVKHAAKDKSWAAGTVAPALDAFEDVEIDTEDLPPLSIHDAGKQQQQVAAQPASIPAPPPTNGAHFAPAETAQQGVTVNDNDGVF